MTMRIRLLCGLLAGLLLLSGPSLATPGAGGDPVLTRSYIEQTYIPGIVSMAKAAARDAARAALPDLSGLTRAIEGASPGRWLPAGDIARLIEGEVMARITYFADRDTPVVLSRGAVLLGGTGTTFTLLSGQAEQTGPALINLSAGKDMQFYAQAPSRVKLMCSDQDAGLRVTSESAAFMVSGYYRILQPYRPLYADVCEALMTVGIVGSYDLERVSRRQEMFIVFLTILGEKAQAEAYGTKHPFNDVNWGHQYVAYLYDNKYTAGTGGSGFSPDMSGSVQQMCFLFLKALGYTDRVDMTYETAVADAVRLGVYSQSEINLLSMGEFRRDQMMYMCYYVLGARYKGSDDTVADRLVRSGFTTREAVNRAAASLTRKRP